MIDQASADAQAKAQALLEIGRPSAALTLLTGDCSERGGSLRVLALLRLDRAQALVQAQRLVAAFPRSAEAHRLWSWALLADGRPLDGIVAARRGLAFGPHDPGLLAVLTTSYLKAGRVDDADRCVHRLLATAPAWPRTHVLDGEVAVRARRPDLARVSYEHALRLDPRDADALAGLARLTANEGRHREAVPLFLAAGTQRPDARLATDAAGLRSARVTAYGTLLVFLLGATGEPPRTAVISELTGLAVAALLGWGVAWRRWRHLPTLLRQATSRSRRRLMLDLPAAAGLYTGCVLLPVAVAHREETQPAWFGVCIVALLTSVLYLARRWRELRRTGVPTLRRLGWTFRTFWPEYTRGLRRLAADDKRLRRGTSAPGAAIFESSPQPKDQ